MIGCVNTMTEDSPLSAVRMSRDCQIDLGIRADERGKLLGMVAYQNLKTLCRIKAVQ